MKKNIWKILLACVLCLCMTVTLIPIAKADFGDFSGDTDYDWGGGDYDWGGDDDYDWDWGSDDDDDYDWDWGNDDDDDYYSYSGSTGSSDVDLSGWNLWDYVSSSLCCLIVAAIIFVPFIISALKKSKNNNPGNYTNFDPSSAQSGYGQPNVAQNLQPISNYPNLDPGFSEEKLRSKASNLYVQMQQCWQNKDIEPLRPYFSDALYSQYELQLDTLRQKGYTNYIDRPAVMGVTIKGYYQTNGNDNIVLNVRARIIDYTVDAGGNIVSGSNSREKFLVYEWVLTRPTGQITAEEGTMQTINCPNCGAPLNINQSARCEYCDSVITLKTHDFVINSIRGISQRTN